MRRGIIKVTPELLEERLFLPPGAKVTGASWNHIDRTIVLSVEHDDLPDVFPREQAQVVTWGSRWHI